MRNRILNRILTWWRSPLAWHRSHQKGVWEYQENLITGERRAIRISGCHGPLDNDWLERREPVARPYPPPPSSND